MLVAVGVLRASGVLDALLDGIRWLVQGVGWDTRFIDALRKALPDGSDADLYWSYHFLSGALTLTFADTKRIDGLSGGLCQSADFEAVHERLVPFVSAGFRALCHNATAEPQRKAV